MLIVCIGSLTAGLIVGWTCGRATMIAKYRKLERVFNNYINFRNR